MKIVVSNLKEFAKYRKINKAIYGGMTYQEKRELKSNIYGIMKERKEKKDLMWEYLNEPMDSEDFIRISMILQQYGGKDD